MSGWIYKRYVSISGLESEEAGFLHDADAVRVDLAHPVPSLLVSRTQLLAERATVIMVRQQNSGTNTPSRKDDDSG